GQPQIPSPVKRIAPNPSRLTGKSPAMLKLDLSLAEAAANSEVALPAKRDAPPASVARRNNRRLMPSSPTRSLFPSSLIVKCKFTWNLFTNQVRPHLHGNIRPAAECSTPAACAPQN